MTSTYNLTYIFIYIIMLQSQLLAYAMSSGAVAPLFFKGSLLDGLLAGIIGLLAGGLYVLSERYIPINAFGASTSHC